MTDDIEVTQEMIEAGLNAIEPYVFMRHRPDLLRMIYRAMHAARPKRNQWVLVAEAIAEMTPEQRGDTLSELEAPYCKSCWRADPSCQCSNDE